MTSRIKLGLVAGLVASVTAATASPPASGIPVATSCLAPDSAAEDRRAYIADFVTTPADSEDRAGWDLPAVPATSISFVTSDSTICTSAAVAHARALHQDTISPASVHLLRVGATRFIAFNYSTLGEYFAFVVLDSAFNRLTVIGS
jgi:hypothetical protein